MSERLEQIKEVYDILATQEEGEFVHFRLDDIEWLIERVDKLEKTKNQIFKANLRISERNNRYHDALKELQELIANTKLPSSFWPVAIGKINEVLEGEADEGN